MFANLMGKMKDLLKGMKRAATERRRKRLAEIAVMEQRERKALVEALAKKFAVAHAQCERSHGSVAVLELSLKEIVFIEWNLKTWTRYFKERQIYEPAPQRYHA